MIYRISKFVHIAVALVSIFLTFAFMSVSDELVLQGAKSNLTVGGNAQNIDMKAANTLVQSVAGESGSNIARLVPDLKNPTSARLLYLAVGDKKAYSTSWLEDGYPDFSGSMTTTVLPFEALDSMDVRGQYVMFGDESAEIKLASGLHGLGLDVSSIPVSTFETSKWFLSTTGLGMMVLVLVLIVLVSSGSGVILNARNYAIQRLQGSSFWAVLGRDMKALGRFLVPLYTATAIVTGIFMYFYNSLHQFWHFAALVALVTASLTVIAVLTHSGILLLVWRVPLVSALKGMIPAQSTLFSIYSVRVIASFLALGIVSATLVLGAQVLNQQASKEVWAANSDLSLLQFKTNLSQEEFMQQGVTFGRAARKADLDGKVVFAQMYPFESLQSFDPSKPVQPIEGPPVVYVNSTYLERQVVVDALGNRILPSDKVRLLIPESAKPEQAKIESTLSFSLGTDKSFEEVVYMKNNQAINAFSSFDGIQADTSFVNAAVLSVPSGSEWMPDSDYYAYATSGGLLFTDPEEIIATTDQTGAANFVIGHRPAALDATLIFQKDAGALRNHLFSTGATLLILVVTSLGAAIIYTRKNSQRIFVSYIHGMPAWRSNFWLLAVEIAAAVALIGHGVALAARESNTQATVSPGASPFTLATSPLVEWAPVVAACIAVASLIFTLVALRSNQSSLIRSRSAEA